MPRKNTLRPEKVLPHDWRERLTDRINEHCHPDVSIHSLDGSIHERADVRQEKGNTMRRLVKSRLVEEGIRELLGVSGRESLEQIRTRDGEDGIELVWWVIEQCIEFYHFGTPKEQEEHFERIRTLATDSDIREMAAEALISLLRSKQKPGPQEKEQNYLLLILDHGLREKLGTTKGQISYNTAIERFVRATFGGKKVKSDSIERRLARLHSKK